MPGADSEFFTFRRSNPIGARAGANAGGPRRTKNIVKKENYEKKQYFRLHKVTRAKKNPHWVNQPVVARSIRLRPAFFARYMAASAASTSASGDDAPPCPAIAQPALIVM